MASNKHALLQRWPTSQHPKQLQHDSERVDTITLASAPATRGCCCAQVSPGRPADRREVSPSAAQTAAAACSAAESAWTRRPDALSGQEERFEFKHITPSA